MEEVEDDLLYMREQKTPEPVFVIPHDDLGRKGAPFYDHLERRTMTADEARAGKQKLDSIILKGSKLLAFRNRTDYVDDALYYMGKAYFYEREWFLSQKKCEEMIANFPESPWLPDAHLVLAMDFMHLSDPERAQVMLSRTIDVAWARKRADVLTEAFRLNADIALSNGDLDGALRPYYRAMIFGDDGEMRARWEYEIGMIYYRQGDFAEALSRFDSVDTYTPNILTQFETGMQRASACRALGLYDQAASTLDDLADNSNFEPWWGMVAMERLNLASIRGHTSPLSDSAIAEVDSVPGGKGYSAYIVYEHGVRAFKAGDYRTAMQNFAKAQLSNAPFQRRARMYALYLTQYFDQTGKGATYHGHLGPESFPDTLRLLVTDCYYNTARVFVNLDVRDSIDKYYSLAQVWAPTGSVPAARAMYARSMRAREQGRRDESDSLLEILVNDAGYSLTDFGADARRRLGYTENAKIDPAEELYVSGKQFAIVGDNSRAISQYERVYQTYPTSSFAPLALYAVGLLYEGPLDNIDSAYGYYSKLVQAYPNSDQANDVKGLIEAYNLKRMREPHNLNMNGGEGRRLPGELVPLDGSQGRTAPVDMGTNPERIDGPATTRPGTEPVLSPPAQPPPRDPRQQD